jgi:hypothetical protein
MKGARYFLVIVIILLVMSSIMSCAAIGSSAGDNDLNGVPGYYATATYGAEMYHAQLTAIAEEPSSPAVYAP